MHFFHLIHFSQISFGQIFAYLSVYGYVFVFIGTLFEGELVLLSAGFAAYLGALNFWYVIFFGFIGATLGDTLWYLIGIKAGIPVISRYGRFIGVSPRRLKKAEKYFMAHGSKTIFFSRFVFGTRISSAVLAGALKMPWVRFWRSNVLGAGVWAVVTASLGYLFGNSFDLLHGYLRQTQKALLILAIFVIIILLLRFFLKPSKA